MVKSSNWSFSTSLAQHERELISQRTREALQAKKAQGFKLGSPQGFVGDAQQKGPPARKQRTAEHLTNRQLAELVQLYRTQEHSYQAIAQKLNASGYRTRQGQAFAAMTVWRLARLNTTLTPPVETPGPPAPTVIKSTTITLRLSVENNSKFVRGKTRTRRHRIVLSAATGHEEAARWALRIDVHVPR